MNKLFLVLSLALSFSLTGLATENLDRILRTIEQCSRSKAQTKETCIGVLTLERLERLESAQKRARSSETRARPLRKSLRGWPEPNANDRWVVNHWHSS